MSFDRVFEQVLIDRRHGLESTEYLSAKLEQIKRLCLDEQYRMQHFLRENGDNPEDFQELGKLYLAAEILGIINQPNTSPNGDSHEK